MATMRRTASAPRRMRIVSRPHRHRLGVAHADQPIRLACAGGDRRQQGRVARGSSARRFRLSAAAASSRMANLLGESAP